MAILLLPPLKWEFTQAYKRESFPVRLGDNYSVTGAVHDSDRLSWNLIFPNLNYQESEELIQIFSALKGSDIFQWSPDQNLPYKDYVCNDWSRIYQGVEVVQVSANFLEIR